MGIIIIGIAIFVLYSILSTPATEGSILSDGSVIIKEKGAVTNGNGGETPQPEINAIGAGEGVPNYYPGSDSIFQDGAKESVANLI
jgi:hypothetical protein